MKNLFILLALFLAYTSNAQQPVRWSFLAKKMNDKTYLVYVTALIEEPWSIYSQSTPRGGPLPTSITFMKNPLVLMLDKVKEQGRLRKKFEPVFNVDVYYYKNKVDFIQTIILTKKVKTKLSGKVEFMACNDEECLPPATMNFSIPIE